MDDDNDGRSSEQFDNDTTSGRHSLWSQFENHVKSVNGDSSHLLDIKVKLNLQKPSKDFLLVQKELKDERNNQDNKSDKNGVCFKSPCFRVIHRKPTERNLKVPTKQASEDVKKAAKRGWHKIKRNVEDVKADRKAAKSEQNWDVLKHCLDDMAANEDAVKQRLYNRYLNDPYKWRENLSHYPSHVKIRVEQERRARERAERTISASPRIKKIFSGGNSQSAHSSRPTTSISKIRPKSTPNIEFSTRRTYLKNAWK
ncbi:DgyrCDS3235 [Dimorphilus gyrociliatus]|uniref:DgyrCDS3235 n=1 Tax=Dimorphilus gyrociliatus TaxID=2664684 RepID=A0A7I8VEI0_9ANNE|nr:DgyrCDS3235 [Dimorphilus gyrociliatus]